MDRLTRLALWMTLTFTLVACGEQSPSTEPLDDVGSEETLSPEEAQALAAEDYQLYCALCHGEEGEGYAADSANALNNPAFLATATDEFLRSSIVRGRPGTPMSAWGAELGGPLDDAAVDRLVDYIRQWQVGPGTDVSGVVVEGEVARGKAQYGARCAGCHGPAGEGGLFMSLNNPEFLAAASDGFIREAIASGRPGTAMKAYADELTEQAIDDLTVLIRSWQVPVSDAAFEAPSADLASATINPGGSPPVFGDDLYVPADTVKAELDAGAAMVVIDARPPTDYTIGHITGAVSVPFYAAAGAADVLPQGVTIVAYCGCPHAESTLAAEALIEAGRTSVKVLDEGYFVWGDRGYPITEGPDAGTWVAPEPPPAEDAQGSEEALDTLDVPDGEESPLDVESEVEAGPVGDDATPSDASSEVDAAESESVD